MQLPPLDRTPSLRPSGADVAAAMLSASAAQSAAPASSIKPVEPTPGVVNLVNQANKPIVGEGVYSSVSDPSKAGSEAATGSKDWTIHRPKAEKVEDPPPVPMSKILLDHIKSLWAASAAAVQIHEVKNQLDMSQTNPNATPGKISTEVLTYSPTKINKSERL